MATAEEIARRVEEVDTARSAKRSTVAQQISELAQRRTVLVDQLENVEGELGDVLADAQDVIDVNELAEFTDVKAGDLTRWLASRTATRVKRRKPATSSSRAHGDASRAVAVSGTLRAGQTPAPREPATTPAGASDRTERIAAQVT
jgi:hypothetical protein